jgi:hypothetical protein
MNWFGVAVVVASLTACAGVENVDRESMETKAITLTELDSQKAQLNNQTVKVEGFFAFIGDEIEGEFYLMPGLESSNENGSARVVCGGEETLSVRLKKPNPQLERRFLVRNGPSYYAYVIVEGVYKYEPFWPRWFADPTRGHIVDAKVLQITDSRHCTTFSMLK